MCINCVSEFLHSVQGQAASICLSAFVVLPSHLHIDSVDHCQKYTANSVFAVNAVSLPCAVCKMHLGLTFLCELTVKEDLHGVCVQVGSLSPLAYPALNVSHGLQFHTKHPYPEIWIGFLGSFSLLNLCSACFLASTQSLEIYDCSRNAFQERCWLSAMWVCQRGIAFPSYIACLMVKPRFFFKHWGRYIVVGREYIELFSFVSTRTSETLGQVAESWTCWGRWEEQRWEEWEGWKWMVLPPNISQPLSWMYSICSSASPLYPSPVCFLSKAHLHGLHWWTLENSGFLWAPPVGTPSRRLEGREEVRCHGC